MGIVTNQTIKNTIITYFGFAIGAINTLFLYTNFLKESTYGLVSFVLSTAALLMPFLLFGGSNTIIKYFSSYTTENEKDGFLSFMLFIPFLISIPLFFIGIIAYDTIANWLASKNAIIKNYTWHIFIIALSMAYFEMFFAWCKVHLKSVFGTFMKEVFHRVCILLLLVAVYFKCIPEKAFIFALAAVYMLRVLCLIIYAFNLRFPRIRFSSSISYRTILNYSFFISIAGTIGAILLDLDKFMLGKMIPIEQIAYYTVAVFMVTIIAVPSRAMQQIMNPLTAVFLNSNNNEELASLYQKSSLNLFIVSGLFFLLVITNANQLYAMLPENFSSGLPVVFFLAVIKLIDNILGNNNAILFNSKYYKEVLYYGLFIVLIAVLLNLWLIPKYTLIGAAIASSISFIGYAIIKILLVYSKFQLIPFSRKTGYVLIVLLALSLLFFFWDFPFAPLSNIILKSILIIASYGFIMLKFNFSEELVRIFHKVKEGLNGQ